IRVSVPAMDHDRLARLTRQLELLPEKIILLYFRVLHPEVIEAELSDRHDLGMLEKIAEFAGQIGPSVRSCFMSVMRMNSEARVNKGVTVGQTNRRFPGFGRFGDLN